MTVTALAMFRVVVHDDEDHHFNDMVKAITASTRLNDFDARIVSYEIEHAGKSVVLTAHKEYAEFVANRLGDHGLTTHLERVE